MQHVLLFFADKDADITKSSAEYQATTFIVNVMDEQWLQDIIDFVVKDSGRIYYVVKEQECTINARGMMLCCLAEAAVMGKQSPSCTGTRDIDRGAIINITSSDSFAGVPVKATHNIPKHACLAVTKTTGTLDRTEVD
ncbi:hypothetical protein BO94DRAFT_590394 [Aspergillus sclerotioniger CBS 115572]|uniref:NAD(P)-binding protein n=1 Tax=Aspergillus sclerotioniger CBS 115572 TaxID=1450535 RepID=A0A317V8A0_9EURO|nr:hypothetical protein BO94DRAFT_590394 [Aspergillus sclerotioniger CBS 115572]PWY69609.1 hypothetical protein BO94DRAFT_590394 [Aspergillus sclerotioniger CBS 115572]